MYLANDILQWCSLSMVESCISSTLSQSVTPGSQTIPISFTPTWVYVGAQLIVDIGTAQEIITVTAVNSTTSPFTLTATFANSHAAGAPLFGATFPTGQTAMPFYTQTEMLDYLADAQKDFLLRVRAVMSVAYVTTAQGQRWYGIPDQATRLERIAMGGQELYNTTQTSLDVLDYLDDGSSQGTPLQWYQDSSGNQTFGLWPLPSSAGNAECWYFDRGPDTLALNTVMTVPDVCAHFLKYRTLAKVWEKDGEQRDPQRAQYCWQRYKLGVLMTVQHTLGLAAFLKEQGEEYDMFVISDRVPGHTAGWRQRKMAGSPQ